jgi:acetyl esterase/lipase
MKKRGILAFIIYLLYTLGAGALAIYAYAEVQKIPADDPRFKVLDAITAAFPPAHITTACHDFLRQNAQPMQEFLSAKGIHAEMKCYGTEDATHIGHVFHVNISLPEATQCNDDQIAFFKRYL